MTTRAVNRASANGAFVRRYRRRLSRRFISGDAPRRYRPGERSSAEGGTRIYSRRAITRSFSLQITSATAFRVAVFPRRDDASAFRVTVPPVFRSRSNRFASAELIVAPGDTRAAVQRVSPRFAVRRTRVHEVTRAETRPLSSTVTSL